MIRSSVIGKALFPKHIFRISRASRPRVDNVFICLEQDGILGYGEASPNSFFKEDALEVQLCLASLADYFLRQTLKSEMDIERIGTEIWRQVQLSRACLCAIDLALWDLWAKMQNKTVQEIAHDKQVWSIPTSGTLGICPAEEWPVRIAEVAAFPAIKVKMNGKPDFELLRAIRSQSNAAIRIDANGAWGGLDIGSLSLQLAEFGVEFIEQPLPPDEDKLMPAWLKASHLPILADESCASIDDIPKLCGKFSGFNIKLVKCGGLTPALKMVKLGRQLGLKTMIGCMLESSLLISAGTVAAQNADYADLDGSWLLREDPFEGLSILSGRLQPSLELGFGVKPKAH